MTRPRPCPTLIAPAVAYVRSRNDWVTAREVAAFLGCTTQAAANALRPAVESGDIERRWRIGGTGSVLSWRVPRTDETFKSFQLDPIWPTGFVPADDKGHR